VIVEGLYLFLQIPVWESICELFDERWFIDCDLDIAMRRVEVRNSIEIGFPPDVVRNPLLFSSILNLFPKTNS
jgi:uridine kinase